MTTIYFIRHAEAEGNLYRIAQGQQDSILTSRGYRQLNALARRFRDIPVDAVYASDLTRTCVTAQAVAVPKGLPIQKRPGLREICVGSWEGRAWGDIAREDPQMLEYFTAHPEQWRADGAESMAAVRDRVLAEVTDIARENEGRTVAVVSHGCALRLLLGHLQGYGLDQMAGTPHGNNTAVSLAEYEDGKFRVMFRDDSSHLRRLTDLARKKASNGVEPGLWYAPLQLPEQGDLLARWAEEVWPVADGGDFDQEQLLAQAAARPTLVAWLEDAPAGCLQLEPERQAAEKKGWISLYCLGPDCRDRGLGVQLLGQAVQYYRAQGRQALRLALAGSDGGAARFFRRCGFTPAGTENGRMIFEMPIISRSWKPEE